MQLPLNVGNTCRHKELPFVSIVWCARLKSSLIHATSVDVLALQIAAFISEPMWKAAGVISAPGNYFSSVYR